jgi:hypothetical protein
MRVVLESERGITCAAWGGGLVRQGTGASVKVTRRSGAFLHGNGVKGRYAGYADERGTICLSYNRGYPLY